MLGIVESMSFVISESRSLRVLDGVSEPRTLETYESHSLGVSYYQARRLSDDERLLVLSELQSL